MNYYIDYFKEFVGLDFIFWFCAFAGSGMFFIQLIMNMFGAATDNFDVGEATISDEIHDAGSDPSDMRKFKWLSMQAITGFLMMFGWTAITCKNEFGFENIATVLTSMAAGVFAACVIRSIFKLAKRLHSPGSAYRIEEAVGREAYVYQRIPQGGVGKISISMQHLTHEINATSHHTEELPSFTRVKIIEKQDGNTVVVEPL